MKALRPFDLARRHPGLAAGGSQVVVDGDRVYLSQLSGFDLDGTFHGLGDAAAQTEQAMTNLRALLGELGGSLADVCKLTTSIVDRAHRPAVYETIGRHLKDVQPCSTGLVVAGLPLPEMMVGIDVEAVLAPPGRRHDRLRPIALKDWFGQKIDWRGCMVVRAGAETFLRGQTGSRLDGSGMVGLGRRPEDAAAQAELAMTNLRTLLEEAGGALDEICKITVYISDRAYREAVYPVIGRHLAGVHPVSTGIIVPAFARPEILFEIDAVVVPRGSSPHERLRKYHSGAARYGREGQNLGCDFCMTVRAGGRLHLRGQTGSDLENRFHGLGDAAAQAEQAMSNVRDLLAEAGAGTGDILKATLYVTDRAYLGPVLGVVARHLGEHRPALSALIVKGLASSDLLMEIDIVAATPR